MTYFTDEQVKLLLRPIHPRRVLARDGMSYVEGYDIRAEMNRAFGFGRWSEEILDQALICETETKTKTYTDKKTGEEKGGRAAWYVVYRTRIRLTVCAPDGTEIARYDGTHVGESTHPVRGEAHGNALTNSETYALRRCAINLGDQFGLSLYNKGSLEAIVRWTLVRPEAGAEAATTDTDDVPQVSAEGTASPAPAEDESAGETFETAVPAEMQKQQEAPADDLWATKPEPDSAAKKEAWLAWLEGALAAAPNLSSLDACKAMWGKSAEQVAAGLITKADATKLQALLRKRMEELKTAAERPAIEGVVVPNLADDWRDKVADIQAGADADAVIEEATRLLRDEVLSPEQFASISTAITARIQEIEGVLV